MTSVTITALYRYPVKGLSPDPLEEVDLDVGSTFPHDRRYAIETGGPRFDPERPTWLPKAAFLCLMKDPALARLRTVYDAAGDTVTLYEDRIAVLRARMAAAKDRDALARALAAYASPGRSAGLRVVEARGHSFSDVPQKVVSIVSLASVRTLERTLGQPLDPLRFRANLYVNGGEPWEESGWVGRTLRGVDGLSLKIRKTTTRCAATKVNPVTGAVDIDTLALLERTAGDVVCGVYAEVTAPGRLAAGRELRLMNG